MSIKHWPTQERPREKCLKRGAASLSDAELLAIFIQNGIAGHSALDIARDVLQKFGSLRKVMTSDYQDFIAAPGLSPNKFALLEAAKELNKRYLAESLNHKNPLTHAKQTKALLLATLRERSNECFAVMLLDSKNRMLEFVELAEGKLSEVSVQPRALIKLALHHNAASIILVHNHPSGQADPSPADIELTHHLKNALKPFDIRVLDHIVVGDNQCTSMAELGII